MVETLILVHLVAVPVKAIKCTFLGMRLLTSPNFSNSGLKNSSQIKILTPKHTDSHHAEIYDLCSHVQSHTHTHTMSLIIYKGNKFVHICYISLTAKLSSSSSGQMKTS